MLRKSIRWFLHDQASHQKNNKKQQTTTKKIVLTKWSKRRDWSIVLIEARTLPCLTRSWRETRVPRRHHWEVQKKTWRPARLFKKEGGLDLVRCYESPSDHASQMSGCKWCWWMIKTSNEICIYLSLQSIAEELLTPNLNKTWRLLQGQMPRHLRLV